MGLLEAKLKQQEQEFNRTIDEHRALMEIERQMTPAQLKRMIELENAVKLRQGGLNSNMGMKATEITRPVGMKVTEIKKPIKKEKEKEENK